MHFSAIGSKENKNKTFTLKSLCDILKRQQKSFENECNNQYIYNNL